MNPEAALIWCPFPDEAGAGAAVAALLAERLIACGNVLPGMTSLFLWQGERSESRETGVLLKTTAARIGPAMARLRTLHPYDTPAILGWTVSADPDTQAWLAAETGTR